MARRAGWPRAGQPVRGKSGLPEATVPGNARAEQSDGKRHRNETATGPVGQPIPPAVRVKRWSKRPPRDWQQDRHGKPHREQRQIGTSRACHRVASAREVRVGSWSLRANAGLEEWSSIREETRGGQNPAYRPSAQICHQWRHRLSALIRVRPPMGEVPVNGTKKPETRAECFDVGQLFSGRPVQRPPDDGA